MCDEISILENFWMFVRSVAQYFVRIVAQYQYQAIVIYTRRKLISVCLLFTEVYEQYIIILLACGNFNFV